MKASKTHVVHSGKYFINIKAIWTQENIKNICCRINGPFQWIANIPTMPKFHSKIDTVNKSVTTLNCLNNSLNENSEITFFVFFFPLVIKKNNKPYEHKCKKEKKHKRRKRQPAMNNFVEFEFVQKD